jgi:hypothetical protein
MEKKLSSLGRPNPVITVAAKKNCTLLCLCSMVIISHADEGKKNLMLISSSSEE